MLPVTVAVNCWVPTVCKETLVGLSETEMTGADVTVTVADADFVPSAALVALTVYVPAVLGAVYSPELDTVPPVALQVTAVFVVPLTVAVNWCVVPVCSVVVFGLIPTTTGAGALTVTVAEADFVESAPLVAVTV